MTEATETGSQPAAETTAPQGEEAAAAAAGTPDDASVTANGERLDRQTRNWRALERDRDHWREMAMRPNQPPPRNDPPAQDQRTPQVPKTLADFEFDEARYGAHQMEEAKRQAREAARAELQQEREREAQQKRLTSFQQRGAAFAKDHPDYDDAVARVGTSVSEHLAVEILESDEGPALAYYLDSNPDALRKLNGLSVREVAREIARLETQVKAEREKAKGPKLPGAGAPPPTPKIDGTSEGSGSSAKPDSPDSDALSDAEWARRRNAQVKARAQRRT